MGATAWLVLFACGKDPIGNGDIDAEKFSPCEIPLNSSLEGEPGWIALTARIDGYQQIYLVDYSDPTNFRRVTHNDHQNIAPTFSPDRTQLIYLDRSTGLVHNDQLVLYDISSDSATPLVLPSENGPFPVSGKAPIVFSPDYAGFYFRVGGSFSGDDIFYWDFTGQAMTNLTQTRDPSEYVIGHKGADTLIAFSNDATTTGQPMGFYLMDLEGNYLAYIDNPHLELINRDGVNKKVAYNPEWNDDSGLFAFAETDSTLAGYRIAVTDLYGTCYKSYTNGLYIDDHPAWGPDGQTVFFHRRKVTDTIGPYKVMQLNLQTGEINEFVKPAVIDGATELLLPDY